MRPFSVEEWGFGPESRLVVLTGAGISAESGLRTFRGAGGLWEGEPIEEVATPDGFLRDPDRVRRFYDRLRRSLPGVVPNPAHSALARLEAALGDRFLLVTQNVDDLHQRAGSARVLAMHGELLKLRCLDCPEHVFPFSGDSSEGVTCPECGAAARPHIVWFGEVPQFMDRIQDELERCTHFAYVGTSSQVYPAAGFRMEAHRCGARVLCVNLEVEPDPATDLFLQGAAGRTVPVWVEAMLGSDGS